MSKAAGIHSACYQVGRMQLVQWLHEMLNENVEKVEDVSSGHHYCILLEALYPGQINVPKIIMNAKLEWEKVSNLKMVQNCLIQHKVDRAVDVDKLAKGKFQDNIEFLQWFKWFFEQNFDVGSGFDAEDVRRRTGKKSTAGTNAAVKPGAKPTAVVSKASTISKSVISSSGVSQNKPNLDVQQQLDRRTKESKFYFNKLREIELYMGELTEQAEAAGLQDDGNQLNLMNVINKVEEVLYATYTE
ncbi:Microtubule binding protein EB1 [Spironucleus salmonicida]|uniref:Microtubule binding protein EB1 n=1 Tax=Spironucleus salmonicida TaxID=348837 RepID=V6LPP1_9EUKA|nr:Microtubule binding protein EB1 [Spironucleus salmonicida]|eukprot:EST45666.1 Microtubule-associated protein, RP/EB family [Spironucleus salmonicida]